MTTAQAVPVHLSAADEAVQLPAAGVLLLPHLAGRHHRQGHRGEAGHGQAEQQQVGGSSTGVGWVVFRVKLLTRIRRTIRIQFFLNVQV